MALVRHFKRRINFIGVVLTATTVWIFYLIISAPAASDRRYENSLLPHHQPSHVKGSVTRKMMDPPKEKLYERPVIKPPPEIIEKEVEVNEKQAIPRPPPARNDTVEKIHPFDDKPIKPIVDVNFDDNSKKVDLKEIAMLKNKSKEKENAVVSDEKKEKNNVTVDDKNTKSEGKEKVEDSKQVQLEKEKAEIAMKLLNETNKILNSTAQPVFRGVEEKVKAIGESVKNKTIEKLVDFGVIKKREYEKLVYERTKWSLNLSIEDIGNIMKDTEYFQKKQNLTEMAYQPLMQPNSTGKINVTSGSFGLGYCDCKDLSCQCCVRVFSKRMRLNSTACATITFSSKSQELQYEFAVNKKPYFERKIAAEFPPKICLESEGKAAGICTLFSNVTAKVNIANEAHKIHLSGCMEFDLTLYNRTVSAFPVGCFQIPGVHAKEKEDNNAQNMGNFMP